MWYIIIALSTYDTWVYFYCAKYFFPNHSFLNGKCPWFPHIVSVRLWLVSKLEIYFYQEIEVQISITGLIFLWPGIYTSLFSRPLITSFWSMGLLQLSNHMVQNRHTGEQMMQWGTIFEFPLFNMSQYIKTALQFGSFVPRDWPISQLLYPAKHKCSTNWGDWKWNQNNKTKSNFDFW